MLLGDAGGGAGDGGVGAVCSGVAGPDGAGSALRVDVVIVAIIIVIVVVAAPAVAIIVILVVASFPSSSSCWMRLPWWMDAIYARTHVRTCMDGP